MKPKGTSTLRRDLTETANEYSTELAKMGMIADQVAPIKTVGEKKSSYPIITRANFLSEDETSRNKDGTYNFIDGEFDEGSYKCEDNGLSSMLDDDRVSEFETFLDFESEMTQVLIWRILRARERRVASMVMSTSVHTVNAAATVWSDKANADPAADIELGLQTIEDKTGIPRSMVSLIAPRPDFNELAKTTAITDLVQYTFSGNGGVRPAVLKAEHIATILEIKEVLIPGLAFNNKPEGEAESLVPVWAAGHVQLAVLAEGANSPMQRPAAFRTMLWRKSSPVFPVVERYYSEDRRGEVLRVRANTDEVATAETDLLNYMIST